MDSCGLNERQNYSRLEVAEYQADKAFEHADRVEARLDARIKDLEIVVAGLKAELAEVAEVKRKAGHDPFKKIEPPADKDALLRLSWLAASCREQGIILVNVDGWISPIFPVPWTPAKATALRRICHHVEGARGPLQANASAFPTMSNSEARRFVGQLHRLHGAGPWPSWWAPCVAKIAEQIVTLSRRN